MKKLLLLSFLLLSSVSKAQDQFTSFRIDTSYSFTEISAVNGAGARARINSISNPGLGLSLVEHWDQKNTTSIKFNYNAAKFEKSDAIPIEGLDQPLVSFGIKQTHSFSSWFRSSLGLFLEEQLFIRQNSPTTLTADKFLNPVLSLDAEFDLLKRKNMDLGAAINLDLTAPFRSDAYPGYESAYNVNAAFGYGGTVYGRKYFKSFSLEGSLYYKTRSAHTTVADQTSINEGVAIRIAVPFGY